MDAVTEVLIDRSHEADIFVRLVIVSLVAHAVLSAAFVLLPRSLRAGRAATNGSW